MGRCLRFDEVVFGFLVSSLGGVLIFADYSCCYFPPLRQHSVADGVKTLSNYPSMAGIRRARQARTTPGQAKTKAGMFLLARTASNGGIMRAIGSLRVVAAPCGPDEKTGSDPVGFPLIFPLIFPLTFPLIVWVRFRSGSPNGVRIGVRWQRPGWQRPD